MREIKFRCYYKVDNTMLEVCEINFTGNKITPTCLFWSPELGLHEAPIEFERDFELMQFTGLKDCNGVKIYEGDIVKYISDFYEVKFIDGAFVLKNIKDNTFFISFFEDPKTAGICIVVGNIHQNKDLLK